MGKRGKILYKAHKRQNGYRNTGSMCIGSTAFIFSPPDFTGTTWEFLCPRMYRRQQKTNPGLITKCQNGVSQQRALPGLKLFHKMRVSQTNLLHHVYVCAREGQTELDMWDLEVFSTCTCTNKSLTPNLQTEVTTLNQRSDWTNHWLLAVELHLLVTESVIFSSAVTDGTSSLKAFKTTRKPQKQSDWSNFLTNYRPCAINLINSAL